MSDNDDWFAERICSCEKYKYPVKFDWEQCFRTMLCPPCCEACGKWADRVQMCVRCSQNYYQFFWHPRMGWESSLPLRGWECWDCLETFQRHVNVLVTCKKTPPPEMVISPFYVRKEPIPAITDLSELDKLWDAI